jgi:hypothetical protein
MIDSLESKLEHGRRQPTHVAEADQVVRGKRDAKSPWSDAWLTPGRFIIFLSLFVLAMFPGVLLGRESFVFRDFGLFSYPVAFFQRNCFWRGEVPLWNPYSQCGVPFLAQWNTMALYPPAIIYLLLPLGWSLSFFCLLHVVWAGLGMYLLARQWTGRQLAAGIAGTIFAFNGLILNFLMWPSHVATMSWLPWVLWLVPRGWEKGRRSLVWAIVAGSAQMLAGGPETILATWLILTTLFVGYWLRAAGQRWVMGRRLLTIVLLVTVVCAAQLGPFLQLVAHSQRDSDYGLLARNWSLPISGWANFLVPLFGTQATPQGVYVQKDQYWTSSYYVGIGTVFLVMVAILRTRDWRVRLLSTWLLAALILALGDHGGLYWLLSKCLPWVSAFRYPAKFVIWVIAVVPLLAAFGLARLQDARDLRLLEWSIVGGVLLLIAGLVAVQWKSDAGIWKVVLQNAVVRGGFLLAFSGLLALWLGVDRLADPNSPQQSSTCVASYALRVTSYVSRVTHHVSFSSVLCGALLLLLFWLDFLSHVPNQNPTASPVVFTPGWALAQLNLSPKPGLGESRAMISPEAQAGLKFHSIGDAGKMYLLDRLGLLANCNLLDELPQAHGFFSLVPGEIGDVTSAPYVLTNRDFSPLLDFMGVSQVTARGETFKWAQRPSALRFINVGQQPVFADDRETFGGFSNTNIDLSQITFFSPEIRSLLPVKRELSARVTAVNVASQRTSFEVETPSTCVATIAQTFYPCWKAYVDGRATKLLRANYAFQALVVPAGKHRIELRYRDAAFEAGAVLSLMGLSVCLILYLRSKS